MNYSNIFTLFETAINNKLKYPKIRLQVAGLPVVLKLAGSKSRYTGDIMLTNDAPYGSPNARYYGRINKTQGVVNGPAFTAAVQALLDALNLDPVTTVQQQALLTGNCSFCEKALNDARSTANGYGPVCAKKYALPWDAAKESKAIRKEIAQAIQSNVDQTERLLEQSVLNNLMDGADRA